MDSVTRLHLKAAENESTHQHTSLEQTAGPSVAEAIEAKAAGLDWQRPGRVDGPKSRL